MRINSISINQPNYQNQSTGLSFTALKLGKKSKYVTEETRELAEKAYDLYTRVVNKKINTSGIEVSNNNYDEGFIKKGCPLKLKKKIDDNTVSLKINSEEPHRVDICMDIDDKYYSCVNYWYDSCRKDILGREVEDIIGIDAENKKEIKIFNKLLKKFLNSSDKIAKLFK